MYLSSIMLYLVEIEEMIIRTPSLDDQGEKKLLLQAKHKEEMKQTDMKLILQLDQKVNSYLL